MTTSPSHHCEARASSSVVFMTFSLVGWFPYSGASLTGFSADASGPGATNQQIIGIFFALWIVPWLAGLLLVSIAIASWLRRTLWILLRLTGIMLAVSLMTYAIG
ncbi:MULTISPECIES: hypothetical protein [unclassified Saccharopolyspora]|uniref:hypothetical protein n=1 Tax=unclassified Saccharopolyspora TaxID=2646250 RepID=UPI001CD55297|nr:MULTISPECIES: hypothetical protein [unclassified Saccharopolyspora]MCA1186900.1 hypothetical protein [Saccharopolyspora sp. 6T]MCA1193337.1 hypothetical protein [Saccharopolyspora sp. 6V]MCA1228046.1 hypothetical protein [Saccharopolyspora sp. 6M]MCA1281384.1 hypothetical protein [Saccharopolyspora sp. 7B]